MENNSLSTEIKQLIENYIAKPGSDRTRPSFSQVENAIKSISDLELLKQAAILSINVNTDTQTNRRAIYNELKEVLRNFILYTVPFFVALYIAFTTYNDINSKLQTTSTKTFLKPEYAKCLVVILLYYLAKTYLADVEREQNTVPFELISAKNRSKQLLDLITNQMIELKKPLEEKNSQQSKLKLS